MQASDNDRIDSHKIHFHPQRVSDWLSGKDIAPIYMEFALSGNCNHRCRFCALDFYGYQDRFLDTDSHLRNLPELSALGVKSILYAGEGEPFLHPDAPTLAVATKKCGIDLAFSTNGVFLTPQVSEIILPHTSWIHFSCNAGTPETYAAIHGTKPEDFQTVIENIKAAAQIRRKCGSRCVLNIQLVLVPENMAEAATLAGIVRQAGADRLIIKPHAQCLQTKKQQYRALQYGDYSGFAAELEKFNSETFKVIVRHNSIKARDSRPMNYERCLALPFWSYVDAGSNVWSCCRLLGKEECFYGNLKTQSVREVMLGESRRSKISAIASGMDISKCHLNCRADKINAYLWELKHPHAHANFI